MTKARWLSPKRSTGAAVRWPTNGRMNHRLRLTLPSTQLLRNSKLVSRHSTRLTFYSTVAWQPATICHHFSIPPSSGDWRRAELGVVTRCSVALRAIELSLSHHRVGQRRTIEAAMERGPGHRGSKRTACYSGTEMKREKCG